MFWKISNLPKIIPNQLPFIKSYVLKASQINKKLTFHPVVFTWHVRGWSSESFCWRHRRLYTLFHALLHTFGGRLMWIDEFGKGSAFHVNVEGEVGAGDVSQFVGHVLTRGTHQLPVFSQLFFCANYRTCQTTLTSEQQTRRHLVSWKQKKRHIKIGWVSIYYDAGYRFDVEL